MKFDIRSRLEFFLAKVAGKDIDLNTIVPAGATNAVEELLLEIADRIDGADAQGGGESGSVVYLDITPTDDTHFTVKINGENATYTDVKALYDAGNLIVARAMAQTGYYMYLYLTMLEIHDEDTEKHAFTFTAYSVESNALEAHIVTLKNDGTNVGTFTNVTIGGNSGTGE